MEELDRQLEEEHGAADEARHHDDYDYDGAQGENVQVMIRCKPLSGKQQQAACVLANEAERFVELAGRRFHYDAVFGQVSSNELVFERAARQLVEASFQGYNCTLFLYGQTGTGKTHTHSGLATASFRQLFALIRDSNAQSRFLIRAAYCEIYNEQIRDLLAAAPSGRPQSSSSSSSGRPLRQSAGLELRENKSRGVYVKDLTWFLVGSQLELERLKERGDLRRAQAATKMNQHSSRSHSILSLTVETLAGNSESPVRLGRLHLVDLAGSERQTKSGSSGLQLKEASSINLSLTCLALVIRALTDPASSHVPYRNSKLTRLLSSSLGGNSKTVLIACVSSSRSDLEESLSTLRFAKRAKRIQNRATVNEDPKDALLRKYRRQIEILKLQIRKSATTGDGGEPGAEPAEGEESRELSRQLHLLRDKIMAGGENLLERAEAHERLLEASRRELESTRRAELELKQRLARKRAALELVQASRKPLEVQVSRAEAQVRRALELYRGAREEQRDSRKEHQQLKENLVQSIRATSRAIKYADCIMDDFIAREHLDLINSYAHYDDESDEWQIKYVALSGNNIAQTRRQPFAVPEVAHHSSSSSSSLAADSPPRDSSPASAGNHATSRRAAGRQEPFVRWRDYARDSGRYKPR